MTAWTCRHFSEGAAGKSGRLRDDLNIGWTLARRFSALFLEPPPMAVEIERASSPRQAGEGCRVMIGIAPSVRILASWDRPSQPVNGSAKLPLLLFSARTKAAHKEAEKIGCRITATQGTCQAKRGKEKTGEMV